MGTRCFTVEQLEDVLWCNGSGQLKEVRDIISGEGRWETYHEFIFTDTLTGKFYQAEYAVGATEMQENQFFNLNAFEKDGKMVNECPEVKPVEVTEVKWEVIP